MSGEKLKDFDDNIHVIPTGETEHDETESCWCGPYHDPDNKKEGNYPLTTSKSQGLI